MTQWIRSPPSARRVKSQARVTAYEKLVEAQKRRAYETGTVRFPPAPRLGNVVVELENVSVRRGDRTLIENLSFSIPPGAIVGIVGPNGSGKSTLLSTILGEIQPDEGVVRIGPTVRIASVSQSRDTLDPNVRHSSRYTAALIFSSFRRV